jgi:hypothetical protein
LVPDFESHIHLLSCHDSSVSSRSLNNSGSSLSSSAESSLSSQ